MKIIFCFDILPFLLLSSCSQPRGTGSLFCRASRDRGAEDGLIRAAAKTDSRVAWSCFLFSCSSDFVVGALLEYSTRKHRAQATSRQEPALFLQHKSLVEVVHVRLYDQLLLRTHFIVNAFATLLLSLESISVAFPFHATQRAGRNGLPGTILERALPCSHTHKKKLEIFTTTLRIFTTPHPTHKDT